MLKTSILAPLILLSVVLLPACDHRSPSGPSPSSVPGPPFPTPPVSVTDVWNIAVRPTTASGGECVGETMRSHMGVPKSYSLSITQKNGTVDVTLRSTSGDYACTFPGAKVEGNGFTTFGLSMWMSCETSGVVRGYTCANGALRDMMSLGENISGQISGNEITGQWNVSWMVMRAGGDLGGGSDIAALETTARYTGSR